MRCRVTLHDLHAPANRRRPRCSLAEGHHGPHSFVPVAQRPQRAQPDERKRRILNFIQTYRDQNQHPPSMREIASYVGISVSTVFEDLAAMQRTGVIEVTRGQRA